MSDLLFFLLTLAAMLAVRCFLLSFARVKGRSMLPTLRDREWLLVWRMPYIGGRPRRFDVVICHYPGRRVKRLWPFIRGLCHGSYGMDYITNFSQSK